MRTRIGVAYVGRLLNRGWLVCYGAEASSRDLGASIGRIDLRDHHFFLLFFFFSCPASEMNALPKVNPEIDNDQVVRGMSSLQPPGSNDKFPW